MADLLSPAQITAALTGLESWTAGGDHITRTVQCPTFPAAITLVDRVAEQAEAMDHHPDIDIRWRTITFTLSTHVKGGVTDLDVTLAGKIDALTAAL